MMRLQNWIEQMQAKVTCIGERNVPYGWISRFSAEYDVLVVDCDQLGDADDVIDFGFRLRQIAPKLPIVMLSSTTQRHDYSSERRAICDATLHVPFTQQDILFGISAAIANRSAALEEAATFGIQDSVALPDESENCGGQENMFS